MRPAPPRPAMCLQHASLPMLSCACAGCVESMVPARAGQQERVEQDHNDAPAAMQTDSQPAAAGANTVGQHVAWGHCAPWKPASYGKAQHCLFELIDMDLGQIANIYTSRGGHEAAEGHKS